MSLLMQFALPVEIVSPLDEAGRFGMAVENIGDIDNDGYEGTLLWSVRRRVVWSLYGTVLYGVCTALCCMGSVRHCAVWSLYGTVLYGVCTAPCCMESVRHCAVWGLYGTVLYGVCTALCCMESVRHCAVWSLYSSAFQAVLSMYVKSLSPTVPVLDVAVGAPYAASGRGVVFVFRGTSGGILLQPSQRIDQSATTISNFGFSLSGPADIDNNGYSGVRVCVRACVCVCK